MSAKDIAWNNVSSSCLYEVTEASKRTSVYFIKKIKRVEGRTIISFCDELQISLISTMMQE